MACTISCRLHSLAGLLIQKVQAEFLLGYRQLIDNDVGSFDDYRAQIAAITVKPQGTGCSTPPRAHRQPCFNAHLARENIWRAPACGLDAPAL